MSVLLDAFGFIAYLRDEPAAAIVQRLLWDESVSMTSVQLAEVVDRMTRVYGAEPDEIEVIVSALGIHVEPIDQARGALAGALRARHYLPTGRSLSLADAICVATAIETTLPVATADPVLLDVLRREGGIPRELPASGASS